MSRLRWIIVIVVGLIVLGAVFGRPRDGEPGSSPGTSPSQVAAATTPAVTSTPAASATVGATESAPASETVEPTAEATPTAAPTATPEPTPTPAPTPTPTAAPATISDGTWEVGVDVEPGTYRIHEPAGTCYWARLSGFGGGVDDIIANELGSGYAVVTIMPTDAGFESSGCGLWSADLARVKAPPDPMVEEGTYIVRTDVTPGRWRSDGAGTCYWARLSGFAGGTGQIIANDLGEGPSIVTIASTDRGFQTNGCGTWTRQP